MNFNELNLIKPVLNALNREGYKTPSPIQERAIPLILEGRDILGCAQTGTGKTAAFAIPMLQILYNQRQKQNAIIRNANDKNSNDKNSSEKNIESKPTTNRNREQKRPVTVSNRKIQALILTPTRELALQISESFKSYGYYTGLKTAVVFGGVNQRSQATELYRGVDILVATPGRLLDLLGQNLCNLSNVSMFVLDEADRMLDMGFINDVKKIIAYIPKERQTLMFSATMVAEVSTLAMSILKNPITVTVTPVSSTVDMIDQYLYLVDKVNKGRLLVNLLQDKTIVSALIFSRTKHGADKVSKMLLQAGITTNAIHGDKSQIARQKALSDFKSGRIRVLVATDIAARGIDIDELSHVINYDLTNEAETYVHRIGRTGRAGLGGIAISFCDFDEQSYLRDIQKLIKKKITVVEDHPYPMQVFERSKSHAQPRMSRDERNLKLIERVMKKKDNAFVPSGKQKKSVQSYGKVNNKKPRY